MQTPDTLCEALEKIREAVRTTQHPAFTIGHVVLALAHLKHNALSRESLKALLGLGEGSIKTLVKHLKAAGLVEVSKSYGTSITGLGKNIIDTIEDSIPAWYEHCFFEKSYIVTTPHAAPPLSLVDVYTIRDYFVEEGCKTIVIGGCSGGAPVFPGLNREMARKAGSCSCKACRNHEQCLVAICPAECMIGCISSMLRYVYDSLCKRPL